MDFEKLLKWGTEYLSSYFSVFVSTLRTPVARFQPVANKNELKHFVIGDKFSASYLGPELNPMLFGFVLISVFVGATLNSLVPHRPPSPDIATSAVVTVAVWLMYSVTVHLACRILKGNVNFWDTLSITLQLLSVVYVVSNLITFLWGSIAQSPLIQKSVSVDFVGSLIEHPIFLYYIIQFVLMLVYLPLTLKSVNGFGLVRQIAITIVPLLWTLFGITAFTGTFLPIQDARGAQAITSVPEFPTSTQSPEPTSTQSPEPTSAQTLELTSTRSPARTRTASIVRSTTPSPSPTRSTTLSPSPTSKPNAVPASNPPSANPPPAATNPPPAATNPPPVPTKAPPTNPPPPTVPFVILPTKPP